MGSFEDIVMYIDREILFKEKEFQGFLPKEKSDFESIILSNFKYDKRGILEEDQSKKQPIPYAFIINKKTKKILLQQRSKIDKDYPEKRLQGKFALGFGGHVEPEDKETKNPLYAAILRELKEEVILKEEPKPILLGYLNDNSDSVGKVHFGIIYYIETKSDEVKINDPELIPKGFMTMDEIKEIPKDKLESWSQILIKPLENFLETTQ